MFKNEKAVRKLIKKLRPGKVFWIEAASGGTQGFPDTVLFRGSGRPVFIELKVGELVQSIVEFEMHNAQRIVLRKLTEAGGAAYLLVGEKGGSRMWLCPPRNIHPKITEGWSETVKGRVPHYINADWEVTHEDLDEFVNMGE